MPQRRGVSVFYVFFLTRCPLSQYHRVCCGTSLVWFSVPDLFPLLSLKTCNSHQFPVASRLSFVATWLPISISHLPRLITTLNTPSCYHLLSLELLLPLEAVQDAAAAHCTAVSSFAKHIFTRCFCLFAPILVLKHPRGLGCWEDFKCQHNCWLDGFKLPLLPDTRYQVTSSQPRFLCQGRASKASSSRMHCLDSISWWCRDGRGD